jgi:uncharacterized 2Fe-2S/4Fe-4S cluster protein (DUF4445 family)
MLLIVETGDAVREIIVEPGKTIAESIGPAGLHLDTRCGGRGTCGRCRIKLLAGVFRVAGKTVRAPAEVNGCQTEPAGETGRIFIPETSRIGRSGQIEAALPGAPRSSRTVLAIDIGTTTVAAALLTPAGVAATGGAFHSQFKFGDNVASRISYASGHPEHLARLQEETLRSIRAAIRHFPRLDEVAAVAVAGNTTMSCLFHRIDPTSIGVMPFTPPCREFPVRPAADFALPVPPGAPVLTAPAVSGYIGGDLVGGLLVTGLAAAKKPELLIDLGTNCEIILQTGRGMAAASAAAGPAFEGAGISAGCRAAQGAIDRIDAGPDRVKFSAIGGSAPVGICGSAYVEFLASARRNGLLNDFGRLERFEEDAGRKRFFRIAGELVITESDIEQLLKAKAAVRAGIQALLAYAGVPLEALGVVHLAGGFSTYLDLAAAQAIGMLPVLPNGEYRIVGNTSLGGAARLAADPGAMAQMLALSRSAHEIPLNSIPGFEDCYIDSLLLP